MINIKILEKIVPLTAPSDSVIVLGKGRGSKIIGIEPIKESIKEVIANLLFIYNQHKYTI